MMNFFNAPFRILAVAGACIIALIALVVNESRARASGVEAILAMQPVDPRSLLSGHYVIVSLQETLPAGTPCPDTLAGGHAFGPWSPSQPAQWIALTPRGQHHSTSGLADTKEAAEALGPLVARGNASCNMPVESPPEEGQPAPPPPQASLFTDLGVDRFYIDQANAERIDRMMRDSASEEEAQVFAIVSIGSDGRARMKGLIVDGERLELSLN